MTQAATDSKIVRISQLLTLVGVVVFAAALALGHAQRAWEVLLVNLVFFTGIAQSGVAFAAAYTVCKGRWGDVYRRLGESLCFFLPISFVLLVVFLIFGAAHVFPWVANPIASKQAWLNLPFLAARDILACAVLFGLSFFYVYDSQRCGGRRTARLAPVLLIVHGLVFTLLAFDLVMSLDPSWYSTLFGWYSFVCAFYAMLAMLVVVSALCRGIWRLEPFIGPDQSHDLGRLLFGFCLFSGGLFWAQWLVFWYGNLPEEIAYVIRRYYEMPFAPYAWVMTYGGFVVPLVVLLSKPLKRQPKRLMWIGVWILAMMWLERYVWIVPAISHGTEAPIVLEALVGVGFAGAFLWCWILHNRRYPIADMTELPAHREH
jgi:hypothetical protein